MSDLTYLEMITKIYGTDKTTIAHQQARYGRLIDSFKTKYDDSSYNIFRTPGRAEISGNHTDHNGGLVLAASVNLDSISVAAKNSSSIISIFSEEFEEQYSIDIKELNVQRNERATTNSLIRGIAFRFKELGYYIGGFNAVISSDVLPGSGLSSSASIEVLIGTIINHFFNDGKISVIEISQISQFAENVYFDKPCGLMDQLACAVGGIVQIDFADAANPKLKKMEKDFQFFGYNLMIINTGGDHVDLTDDYASIPFEMKQLANELGGSTLSEVEVSRFEKAIPRLREKFGDRAVLRAIHFFNESNRVSYQIDALEKLDFKQFLKLFNDSGSSSFRFLQNVYTQKDVIHQSISLAIALTEQFFKNNSCNGGVRIHGGGFAGTILSLVPIKLTEKYIGEMDSIFGGNSTLKLELTKVGTCLIQ